MERPGPEATAASGSGLRAASGVQPLGPQPRPEGAAMVLRRRGLGGLTRLADRQADLELLLDLRRPTRGLFRQWSRCRGGTISRAELKSSLDPVRRAVEGLLLRGRFSGHPRYLGDSCLGSFA